MSKSEAQVLDFEKICRLCLLEKRSMSSIFSKKKSDKKVPLPVRIMSCASLELYEGDGLPSSICSKCLLSVNQSFAFRKQCEEADTTLRQYAQRVNEATEEASLKNPFLDELRSEDGTPKYKNGSDGLDRTKGTFEGIDKKECVAWESEILLCDKGSEILLPNSDASKAQDVRNVQNDPKSFDVITRLAVSQDINVNEIDVDCGHNQKNLSTSSQPTMYMHVPYELRDYLESSGAKGSSRINLIAEKPRNNDDSKNVLVPKTKQKKGFVMAQFYLEYAGEVDDRKSATAYIKNDLVYCKVCEIFICRPYFYNHVKYVHKNIRNHLCQSCGYRAQTGHVLREHIESKHSDTILTCENCSMTFTCSKRLKLHVNKHHSGKPVERKFVCHYCGKTFTAPCYLKSHMRVHTHETPYECQFCKRKFKFKWACKTHERLHTGVKPYKCSYCEEAFTQNCSRKNHEYRIHGNEAFNPKKSKKRK